VEFRTENSFKIKPESLLQILTSETYLLEQAEHYRSLDATVEYKKKTKTKVEFVVSKTEYMRSMTGGVDKSKTEIATEAQTWDLKKMSCTWVQGRESFGKMISISGSSRIEANGKGCTVINQGDIDIKIPIVGKKISKGLVKKLENDGGRYQKFVEAYIKKHKIK
jgi:Protein of unknown function (DUF2505)